MFKRLKGCNDDPQGLNSEDHQVRLVQPCTVPQYSWLCPFLQVSWDEVFALWPRMNLDWDLLRCVPGFFRPDAGDPVTEDRLRRSGVRQEREEREKEDQVRHPLNRATAKQKKVYSGRKKKFYFVFFVFFERHFRFFVRLYFCHRMLKWRGKSSSQENDDISLRLKKAKQIDLNVPSCLSLSQLLLNTDFLFDSGCRAEKAEQTHFFVKSKQTGWK